ncbi:hypothetical protein MOUN0_H07822 [Monosporozyma unispora]
MIFIFFNTYLQQPLLFTTTISNLSNDLVEYYPKCQVDLSSSIDCVNATESVDRYLQYAGGAVCTNKFESEAQSTFPESGYSTNFIRDFRFYFSASQFGVYTFRYEECSACCAAFTGDGWAFDCNKVSVFQCRYFPEYLCDKTDAVYNYIGFSYEAGKFYPFEYIVASSSGDAHMKMSVTAPDGTVVNMEDAVFVFYESGECPSTLLLLNLHQVLLNLVLLWNIVLLDQPPLN